jgi:YVTN family beta-propeller protein
MRRGGIAGLLSTALALVGCGAATLSGVGEVSSAPAPQPARPATVAAKSLVVPSSRTVWALPRPAVPADGEAASEAAAAPTEPAGPDPLRHGPVLPAPAGPPSPSSGVVPVAVPPGPVNIYAYAKGPQLSPAVADIPTRVYVPNSDAATVSVIDPATGKVTDRFGVGARPHHITPSWDLTKLYVNNTEGNSLTVIDPRSGKVSGTIPITDPYNLYFTPDGTKAIVVAERFQRLDFYDASSWKLIKSVPIPWPGVDHGDFTADGRYLLVSTEFSGQVVKVDTETMAVASRAEVGGLPIDVKASPDGAVFYVTNQSRNGVSLVDPETMKEIGFLRTGVGAHGLSVSRDGTLLYVSNRMDGTMSVIDFATRQVRETWKLGGSPDMIQLSTDGTELWVSNRFQGSVTVVDTATGKAIRTVATGAGAHGVSFFPQPGRYSIGHNGVYR